MRPTHTKARRLEGNEDRIWVISMLALVAFMLLVVAVRWYEDSRPPEIRFGVPLVTVERQGGQAVVSVNDAPTLTTEGGVVAVRAGAMEGFIVRTGSVDYAVWDRQSARGREVRYDVERGIFIDRGGTIGFDRTGGNCLSPGEDDRLVGYPCRGSTDSVEIQLIAK